MDNKEHKLFISYSQNDENLIDTITRRLEIEFGRKNIFYDKWSIYPGKGIIEGMNQGLEDFDTFFFFVSPNSLASKMVSVEWQSALNRAIKKDLKFVPVRIADCEIPAIIAERLYIDLYGEGLDSAVEKMKKVVRSESVYDPLDNVQNLVATARSIDDSTIQIELEALYYSEDNPEIAFACKNEIDYSSICFDVEFGRYDFKSRQVVNDQGVLLNAKIVTLYRAIKPGFPYIFQVYFDKTDRFEDVVILQLKDSVQGEFQQIPLYDESGTLIKDLIK